MFEIDKRRVITETDKLLYNIWECLNKPVEIEKSIEIIKPKLTCKYCGGTHENKGQVLSCAKKHKKGSV